MSVALIFQRMLMLLAMMGLGYIGYKVKWIDDYSYSKLSAVVVNIFNPALVINGALTATAVGGTDFSVVKENMVFIGIYFSISILISIPIARILAKNDQQKIALQLMTIFSNVGFMGIPVISGIYGKEAIIYVTFYILGYNLLLYTLGTSIAQKSLPKEQRKSSLSSLLNVGTICAVVSMFIFFFGIKAGETVGTFFDYVGNATIPLSMMVIGASVAKMPIREIFKGIRVYVFSFIKLLLIPITMSFLFRPFAKNDMIFGIFILMFSMPVGSIITMLIEEYGGDESYSSRSIIITTLLSIVTIPIVVMFL
ncbi:MAG: AEC family transporter [Lachnospiraceae bacterium]|nr:AEC family transporter [Lachnospiraceae bacterium]